MPDIPQSEIVATNFYDWAKFWAKNWAKFWTNFLGIFVLRSLCTMTHQNFSPISSQFVTPCLVTAPVTEISKFHLRSWGLGVPNKKVIPRYGGYLALGRWEDKWCGMDAFTQIAVTMLHIQL